jgi:hypothetical protein
MRDFQLKNRPHFSRAADNTVLQTTIFRGWAARCLPPDDRFTNPMLNSIEIAFAADMEIPFPDADVLRQKVAEVAEVANRLARLEIIDEEAAQIVENEEFQPEHQGVSEVFQVEIGSLSFTEFRELCKVKAPETGLSTLSRQQGREAPRIVEMQVRQDIHWTVEGVKNFHVQKEPTISLSENKNFGVRPENRIPASMDNDHLVNRSNALAAGLLEVNEGRTLPDLVGEEVAFVPHRSDRKVKWQLIHKVSFSPCLC